MPADGSAAPSVVDAEPGRVATLLFPVQGAGPIWGVVAASFVYYETWLQSTDWATHTVTRSGTQSGIVGIDGTVVQAPLADSTFVNGGEQAPWPNDTTTTATPYLTLFQVRGLSPVSVTNSATGVQYVEDAVSGGSLIAIDAGTNQAVATVGTLPISTATALSGTFRGTARTGFLEATNALSTGNPTTRDLYELNSQTSNSLARVTDNL
jgi:hypothetical protein